MYRIQFNFIFQGPGTNNALERANRDYKENYTQNKRQSISHEIETIKQFIKEYGEEADEQEHLKQREIEEADKYLMKYDSFLATKTISETSTRRLMIKKKFWSNERCCF